jgi:hypothetical protein
MPTVNVDREVLFDALGTRYSEEAFGDLCFEFGIELDEVVDEDVVDSKKGAGARAAGIQPSDQKRTIYKIEIPANRYECCGTRNRNVECVRWEARKRVHAHTRRGWMERDYGQRHVYLNVGVKANPRAWVGMWDGDCESDSDCVGMRMWTMGAERVSLPGFALMLVEKRYDLLCLEGLSRALRVFLGKQKPPKFVRLPYDEAHGEVLRVGKEVGPGRRRMDGRDGCV